MSETNLYSIPLNTLAGTPTNLEPYRGKVLVIVNVASKCGFTGQYAGLEALYQKYKDKGLVVLGFPCNQFLFQEPGDAAGIQQFCSTKYNVTFPLFEKVKVNGPGTHPLYEVLKRERPGILGLKAIKWNFTKFLVNKEGKVMKRFGSTTSPEKMAKDIESLLA